MIDRSPKKSGWLLLSLTVLSAPGCGTSGQPADPAQAQKALHAALDAWKAGGKPEDLASQTPPIKVTDQEWNAGWSLLGYKADAEGKLVGFDMNYSVELELKNAKGNPVKKKAVYTVTTRPENLVLRQEG